jgi:hypothetical protein
VERAVPISHKRKIPVPLNHNPRVCVNNLHKMMR